MSASLMSAKFTPMFSSAHELDMYSIPRGTRAPFPASSERAIRVQVTYSVKPGAKPGTGEVLTEMEAKHIAEGGGVKKVATPVNLTNHAYWNLSGDRKRSVRGHGLEMRCDRYLHMDDKRVRPAGGALHRADCLGRIVRE